MADLIFTKYSNERCRRLSVRTDIMEENGTRFVRKTALYPEGQEHICKIYDWYQKLSRLYEQDFFCFNRGTMEEQSLVLEYVEGQTLDELLGGLLLQGEVELAEQKLRKYLTMVEKMYAGTSFVMTEEFQEVFGNVELPDGLLCGAVTNIDMVCSNLVLTEKPTVLDYEWTFDFPVPGKFVLYRILRFLQEVDSVRKFPEQMDFYQDYGITPELKQVFAQMEENFQDYIIGAHVPMRKMYSRMSPGSFALQIQRAEQLQIFFKMGSAYSQEDSIRFPIRENKVSVRLALPEGCKEIRLDQGDSPCAVYVSRIAVNDREVSLENARIENGYRSGRWIYITKTDPYIADIPVMEESGELLVQLHVYPTEQKVLEGMIRQLSTESAFGKDGRRILTKIRKCFHR